MEYLELLKNLKQAPSLSEEEQRKLNNVLSNIGENVAELAGLLLKAYHLIPEDTPIDIRRPEFVGSPKDTKKNSTSGNATVHPSSNDNANASPAAPVKKRKRFPDEPKPPRSSFFHYLEDARKKLLTDGLPAGTDAIAQTKIIAVQWKSLSDEEKQVYTLRAQEDRNRYDRDIEVYCQQYPDRAADVLQEAKKFRRSSEKRKADSTPTSSKSTLSKTKDNASPAGTNHKAASDDDAYSAEDSQFVFKMEEDSPEDDEEEEIDEINDSDIEDNQQVAASQRLHAS